MCRKLYYTLILIFFSILSVKAANKKILFDATKAEMAGNADWVIDADSHNLGTNGSGAMISGSGSFYTESNPQRIPTLNQSQVNGATAETFWDGSLSAWAIDMVNKGYTVETLPYNGSITYGNGSNPQDLSNYAVFVIDEPNILFTSTEKTAILNFVKNGGGLMMISDHDISDRNNDGYDSPHIWNDLMSNNSIAVNPFGLTFDYLNLSETSTNSIVLSTDSLLHGPMGDASSIKISNGTTMSIDNTKNATAKGVIYKTGSAQGNSNAFVARAYYENGKVAAFGDSSPMDDGTGDTNDALHTGWSEVGGDHERLIVNTTVWLATHSVSGTPPATHIINNDTTICAGATVVLNASGADTYSWQGGPATATYTVSPAGTTTYIVAGTSNSISVNDTVTITVKQLPVLSVNSPSICTGTNTILTASGNSTSYSWSPNISNTNTATTPVLSANTTYTVTGTTNGCSTSAVATVTVKPKPNVSIIASATTVCSGTSSQLTASGAASYNWQPIGSGPVLTVLPSVTSTFTVTGTTAGCDSAVSITITVLPTPGTPTLTQGHDTIYSNVFGTTYNWYKNFILRSTTTTPYLLIDSSGSYTLTVSSNGCTSSMSDNLNAVITGIKYNRSDLAFTISPNPSNGNFQIRFKSNPSSSDIFLQLTDLRGDVVFEKAVSSLQENINVTPLPSGIYYLVIRTSKDIFSEKILINHL